MTSPEQYESWAKEAVYERDDATKRAEALVEALERIATMGAVSGPADYAIAIARQALAHYKEQG